jgi:hypothetical protein
MVLARGIYLPQNFERSLHTLFLASPVRMATT